MGKGKGWASIGVARSNDGGRTWPRPVAQPGYENDAFEYGDGRYAGITLPGTPPSAAADNFYGDALPSAFVDEMDPSGSYYLYVPYQFSGAPGVKPDSSIHIARAKLGDRFGHHEEGPLHFTKWFNGKWSEKGRGGNESGVTPICQRSSGDGNGQISYNDALHLYMMTFACRTYACKSAGNCTPTELALYFTTATSLEAEDWTQPQLIENSAYPVQVDAQGGQIVDGGYPTFVSPQCRPGHLGLSGKVLFLKGDVIGSRVFAARSFKISFSGSDDEKRVDNACGPLPAPG